MSNKENNVSCQLCYEEIPYCSLNETLVISTPNENITLDLDEADMIFKKLKKYFELNDLKKSFIERAKTLNKAKDNSDLEMAITNYLSKNENIWNNLCLCQNDRWYEIMDELMEKYMPFIAALYKTMGPY